jgi:hypothetical protein
MKARADLQFWGGTIIWVVPSIAGSAPRAVTQKSPDEVYDLKWMNNGMVVFDRVRTKCSTNKPACGKPPYLVK